MTETASSVNAEIARLHILVVDDDQTFLSMMQAMLGTLGVKQVTTAHNGSDAISKLLSIDKVVDCILCDYGMDGGDGLQLLQAIRQGKLKLVRPDTCFILVTGSGVATVVGAAAQLDVNGYVVKPIMPKSLEAAIVKGRARSVRLDFAKYAQVTLPRS